MGQNIPDPDGEDFTVFEFDHDDLPDNAPAWVEKTIAEQPRVIDMLLITRYDDINVIIDAEGAHDKVVSYILLAMHSPCNGACDYPAVCEVNCDGRSYNVAMEMGLAGTLYEGLADRGAYSPPRPPGTMSMSADAPPDVMPSDAPQVSESAVPQSREVQRHIEQEGRDG